MTSSSTDRPSGNRRPFAFDTEFSPDGRILREGTTTRLVYTAEEVAAEVTKARDATRAEQAAVSQRRIAEATEKLVAALAPVTPRLEADARELRRDAVELAVAMVKAVIGPTLEAHALAVIVDGFTRTAASLPSGPRIRLAVEPSLLEPLAPVLHGAAGRHGLEGRIELVAAGGMRAGDWSLSWEAGAIHADHAASLEALTDLISRRLAEADAAPLTEKAA
jgi:flagellar biosynthesis/type III secretory pathway protein FliH